MSAFELDIALRNMDPEKFGEAIIRVASRLAEVGDPDGPSPEIEAISQTAERRYDALTQGYDVVSRLVMSSPEGEAIGSGFALAIFALKEYIETETAPINSPDLDS